ncbi:MAG: PUA domain-containing protein [archaeon]
MRQPSNRRASARNHLSGPARTRIVSEKNRESGTGLERISAQELRKLWAVANYQFGRNVGEKLFDRTVMVGHSLKTGRMKLLYRRGRLLGTLRPSDGLFALSIEGAKRLLTSGRFRNVVTVRSDVAGFIKKGKNVFAKHVTAANPIIRPEDEVVVVDERRHLLAVGRASLSADEMLQFKRGIAVNVRRGVDRSPVQISESPLSA